MAEVKFVRTEESSLESVAVEDGQLVLAKDSGNLYADVGEQRIAISSGAVDLSSIEARLSAIESTLSEIDALADKALNIIG